MSQPERMRPWPERFREGGGLEPEPDGLKAAFSECVKEAEPSERVARRAARRALDRLDARRGSVGPSWLQTLGRYLNPKRVLVAVGVVLLLQLGVALAEEIGPRGLAGIGEWFEREATTLGIRHPRPGPAPTIASARDEAVRLADPGSSGAIPAEAMGPAETQGRDQAIGLWLPDEPSAFGSGQTGRESLAKRRRGRAPAPAPSLDSLGSEAAVVSRAVSLASKDPHGALVLLSGYWRDFPAGELRGEAAVAEVSALQSLGKHAEALAALDGWARDQFRGMNEAGDELGLTRLELMVGAGRCVEALPLLERQLSAQGAPRRQGRALLARAACRGKTGDSEGNQADLERYLKEFPDGSRAVQVRHALGIGD